LTKHGIDKSEFSLSAKVVKKIITDYAREPGVRVMEQFMAKLCRKAALEKVSSKRKKKFSPGIEQLEELLGPARFQSELAGKAFNPGIVTGLAWTSFGGEILFIETLPLKGKGLKLTGQLGDVMNESANLAYSYVKSLLQLRGLKKEDEFLANHEVHLHLPAGATPKDGPSAGITMALALYSLASNKKVKSSMAMTGELSLTGKVLPVGGIKEKVLAAKRAGIKTILLPQQNEKDLKEVPERHRRGMKFYPVAHFDEVLKIALSK
jgi:ATP-dependent Lon protease